MADTLESRGAPPRQRAAMILPCACLVVFVSFVYGASVDGTKKQLASSILQLLPNTSGCFQHLDFFAHDLEVKASSKFDSEAVQKRVAMGAHHEFWQQYFSEAICFDYEVGVARKMSNLGTLWIPRMTKEYDFYVPMLHKLSNDDDVEMRMHVKPKSLLALLLYLSQRSASLKQPPTLVYKIQADAKAAISASFASSPLPVEKAMQKCCMFDRFPDLMQRKKITIVTPFPDFKDPFFSVSCKKGEEGSYYAFLFFFLAAIVNVSSSRDMMVRLEQFFPQSKLLAIKAPFKNTHVCSDFVLNGGILDGRPFMLMTDLSEDSHTPLIVKAYARPGDMLIGMMPSGVYPKAAPLVMLLRDYDNVSLAAFKDIALDHTISITIPKLRPKEQVHLKSIVVYDALNSGILPNFLNYIDAKYLSDPLA